MLEFDDLRPYASFRLASIRQGAAKTAVVDQILDDANELVESTAQREFVQRLGNSQAGDLWAGFLIYTATRSPSWTTGEGLEDLTHHLLLVARRDRHVAVYASEPAMGRFVSAGMNRSELTGLSALAPIPAALLNTAYGRGAARTLWLSGIHRRTSSKADSKILTGADLQDALDPLDDQSYHFTSARTQPGLPNMPSNRSERAVGFTPRDSRVWAGSVREFVELRQVAYALLGRLKEAETETLVPTPFAVLAAPISTVDEVDQPYDVSVVAPELLSGDPIEDEEEEALAERWAYRSAFSVVPTGSTEMRVGVEVDGQHVGELDLALAVGEGGETSVDVVTLGTGDDLGEAADVFHRPSWLTVHFESGHTLSNGALYSVRHRDIPFKSWVFADFTGFDVKKEKPPTSAAFDPGQIGNHDSLFCWVKLNWPLGAAGRGWLACDDGAGEIADFVHFDPAHPDGPLLSLIHVKASGSGSTTRQISTSDYEVVIGQAVKNLRHLDRTNLADRLEEGAGSAVALATWNEGVVATRQDLVDTLRAAGDDYRRRLVVVQPRVTSTELGLARAAIDDGQTTGRAARLRQLDTLLLEAESSARDLSATFSVLGDSF